MGRIHIVSFVPLDRPTAGENAEQETEEARVDAPALRGLVRTLREVEGSQKSCDQD